MKEELFHDNGKLIDILTLSFNLRNKLTEIKENEGKIKVNDTLKKNDLCFEIFESKTLKGFLFSDLLDKTTVLFFGSTS